MATQFAKWQDDKYLIAIILKSRGNKVFYAIAVIGMGQKLVITTFHKKFTPSKNNVIPKIGRSFFSGKRLLISCSHNNRRYRSDQ